jgi:threonine/homoserine/homoserine lactone efflux protein
MIHILLQGILLGFTLAIFIGPAFFTLLQTSIHRGFQSAFLLAIGIIFSDMTLIILSYLGATQIIDKPENQFAFGFVGGIILIIIGIVTFTRKVHMDDDSNETYSKRPGPFTFIIKGYFLNIANPFIWIFWMGVMGFVTSNFEPSDKNIFIFYAGTLCTVFITDLIKSFIANKIKQFLKPNSMTIINRLVGLILVAFGIILMWRVIY